MEILARHARTAVEDLTREQRKADADVEQVKARRVRDQDRIDRGLVANPRDLEHLQHELVSLTRRIGALEDLELEVLEKLEDAQGELTRLEAELASLDAVMTSLRNDRDTESSRLATEMGALREKRAEAADGVPGDLMALYDKLRATKGGVGAAALHARKCKGCSLELNASDRAVIARTPPTEVIRCEECDRILVRTGESGL